MNVIVCLSFMLFVAMAKTLVYSGSQGGTVEYVVSITTPNITLVDDDIVICVAYNMTSPTLESDFIVGFDPKPFPGMKEYFFFDSLCEEPGYVGPKGDLVPWDCGVHHNHPLNPPLPRARICASDAPHLSTPRNFQYQNRPLNESRLRLPEGTGIPIGGKGDPKFVVLGVHIPHRMNAPNSATGFSTLNLTLKRHGPEMLVAHDVVLYASGLVDAHSHGKVSTSWTWDKEEDLRLITLYVHVHHMGIKAEVRIERTDNETDVILDQDPKKFMGVTYLPDSPSVHMRAGDRLVFTCFYFNRMDHVLVIGQEDKCFSIVHYVVAGDTRGG